MDVKNAFLHGSLSEIVYMTPPLGYNIPTGHVCLLRRVVYGLKQDPQAWFECFRTVVLSGGFMESHQDPLCLSAIHHMAESYCYYISMI